MTARKKNESEQDDTKTAGKDESKTTQTTKQAEDNQVSDKVEDRGETDVEGAASGGVAGGVVAGDTGLADEDDWDEYAGGGVASPLGSVPERDLHGDSYEVPWKYVDNSDFDEVEAVRTSDTDDPARSWTAQEASEEREDDDGNTKDPVALTPVQATPGQTFRASELPNVEVMKAAGINVAQFLGGLPVRADVPDEAPRKGIPA